MQYSDRKTVAPTNANHDRFDFHAKAASKVPVKHTWSWWHRFLSVISGLTFLTDTAEFQVTYDRSYRHRAASFRLDNGWRLDYKADANMKSAMADRFIKVIKAYLVHIPGQEDAQLARVRQFMQAHGFPIHVVYMIDEESGSLFAGTGDHSVGANKLFYGLAELRAKAVGKHPARAQAGVDGYANGGDWQSCWPQHPNNMKRVLASYTSQEPDGVGSVWYQWQYGDGQYPTPNGYPTGASPFGSAVDLNVIKRGWRQVEFDYGITIGNSKKNRHHPTPHHHKRPVRRHTFKTHAVTQGDTLTAIAHEYHTTVPQLQKWNARHYPSLRSNPNKLQLEWVLRVSAR